MASKIIVTAGSLHTSAPGIVFGNIIKSFPNTIIPIVASSDTVYQYDNKNHCPQIIFQNFGSSRKTQQISRFGISTPDYFWAIRESLVAKKSLSRVDGLKWVLTMTCQWDFSNLYFGKLLAKSLNLPWAVYCVDAIPPPLSWDADKKFQIGLGRLFSRALKSADYFFSSNDAMLEYETQFLGNFKGKKGVLYTPYDSTINWHSQNIPQKRKNFLYPGGFYGPRTSTALLEGFALLLKEIPDAKLFLVGKSSADDCHGFESLIQSGNIEIHGFTSNLDLFYNIADVLIDVNANLENDIFLSSKIITYLPIGLPILSISGKRSPVRTYLNDIPHIVNSYHDGKDIYKAMLTCLSMECIKDQILPAISRFSADNVANSLINSLGL